ncbi:MAG TPA: hypothetical protein VGD19_11395 [Allosphingosinicella sp.]|jgi:hypothetical protein
MSQHEFFLARAADAQREADAATLDNVRQRCMRSHAAWADMAARAGRTERMRAKAEADKAAAGMAAE